MGVQQAPGIWRTDLQQHDLSVPGREVIQNRVDIGPERHSSGTSIPARRSSTSSKGLWSTTSTAGLRRRSTPARSLSSPPTRVHAVRNVGSGNAAELATYIVEKGKPFLLVVE